MLSVVLWDRVWDPGGVGDDGDGEESRCQGVVQRSTSRSCRAAELQSRRVPLNQPIGDRSTPMSRAEEVLLRSIIKRWYCRCYEYVVPGSAFSARTRAKERVLTVETRPGVKLAVSYRAASCRGELSVR